MRSRDVGGWDVKGGKKVRALQRAGRRKSTALILRPAIGRSGLLLLLPFLILSPQSLLTIGFHAFDREEQQAICLQCFTAFS